LPELREGDHFAIGVDGARQLRDRGFELRPGVDDVGPDTARIAFNRPREREPGRTEKR